MYFDIDPKFLAYFRNLKQVFLYITDECNLRCKHCLYKPNLTFHIRQKKINFDTSIGLISDLKQIGADKLTLIGGEPTLYGTNENHLPLFNLISRAENLGYKWIRISTNGQFEGVILLDSRLKKINEIAFSLDGFSQSINDPIRGIGSFDKCVNNIKKAVNLGYNVSITCCIHKNLLDKDRNGIPLIEKMIEFAQSLNINTINFHDLFKCGVPMDTWTGDFDPPIEKWVQIYQEVKDKIKNKKFRISVRLPQCFITKKDFRSNPKYYGYCPVKLGERVMVHPNGIIRICSNLICTPFGVAKYFDKKIVWDNTSTNETLRHEKNKFTPCTNRGRRDYGDYFPLCFSFKPNQDEFIWNRLNWESRIHSD